MITIIDLGISNIASLTNAMQRIGVACQVSRDAYQIQNASALILPGVGAFADGMAALNKYALVEPLRAAAKNNTPILGICLGMQLLADESEEHGLHAGLGIISGRVTKLKTHLPQYRIPNIGWYDIKPTRHSALFTRDTHTANYYFVHSYYFAPTDPNTVLATMTFSASEIPVAVAQSNVYGVQFHPEKSQDDGLQCLLQFTQLLH